MMSDASRAPRGRPKLASAALLEEAAFELFLENGYARTTVEQIATRAGVSRNTFFNYFQAKSDVFWVGLDASIERLARTLGEPGEDGLPPAVREALHNAAADLGPSSVPWVLTHFELIGSTHEVMASALGRASQLAELVQKSAARSLAPAPARSLAFATVGAVVAAMQTWAESGPDRGSLAAHLDRALEPLRTSFEQL